MTKVKNILVLLGVTWAYVFIFYTMLGEICIEKDMKAEFWIFLSVLQKYCSIFSESPSILSCQNHSDFFCTTKKRSDSSWNAFLKPAAQILYILIQHVGRHLMNLFVCTYYICTTSEQFTHRTFTLPGTLFECHS